jgi:hypothetical protein
MRSGDLRLLEKRNKSSRPAHTEPEQQRRASESSMARSRARRLPVGSIPNGTAKNRVMEQNRSRQTAHFNPEWRVRQIPRRINDRDDYARGDRHDQCSEKPSRKLPPEGPE